MMIKYNNWFYNNNRQKSTLVFHYNVIINNIIFQTTMETTGIYHFHRKWIFHVNMLDSYSVGKLSVKYDD